MGRKSKKRCIGERIKKVQSLEKELKQIREAQHNLGYTSLEKPIRDGWFKTFKLRDDIAKNKNAKVFKEVLDTVGVKMWGSNKTQADKNWLNHFKASYRCYQRLGIKYISTKDYLKLSAKAKLCFLTIKYKQYKFYRVVYLCLLPRYYFEIDYKRAYITSRRIIEPLLESREQEIMEILNCQELRTHSLYFNYNYRHYKNLNKARRLKAKTNLKKIDINLINND